MNINPNRIIVKKPMPEYSIPEYLESERKIVLEEALKFIGTPYCYGGKTPFCSDCSGFVLQVYKKIGITTPRTAHDQYVLYGGEDIIPEPGDLLFFRYAKQGKIAHVGIYAGEDFIIHASEKKGVILTTLEYMRKHIVGYGRLPLQEISSK
jgi:cell wall-associated NlpC family hydrolase